jgi:hypothetical protein
VSTAVAGNRPAICASIQHLEHLPLSACEHGHFGAENVMSLHRPVIVYLDAGAIRGTLQTLQPRVLDELHDASGSLTLRDVTLLSYRVEECTPADRQNDQVVLRKRQVLLMADLTPRPCTRIEMQVPRERFTVTLAVGPYWVNGCIHLPIGTEPVAFLDGSGVGFTPLTDAQLVKLANAPRQTLLVNREKISCIIVHQAA